VQSAGPLQHLSNRRPHHNIFQTAVLTTTSFKPPFSPQHLSNRRSHHTIFQTAVLTTTSQRAAGATSNQAIFDHDKAVHADLKKKGIKPVFFAFRWLTCLISQEFPLPDVIRLVESGWFGRCTARLRPRELMSDSPFNFAFMLHPAPFTSTHTTRTIFKRGSPLEQPTMALGTNKIAITPDLWATEALLRT
jgi:hypothetical protein